MTENQKALLDDKEFLQKILGENLQYRMSQEARSQKHRLVKELLPVKPDSAHWLDGEL